MGENCMRVIERNKEESEVGKKMHNVEAIRELEYENVGKVIELPAFDEVNIINMIINQGTTKNNSMITYKKEPISLEELSYIIWNTQAAKSKELNIVDVMEAPNRVTHTFETYIFINNVEGVNEGLYRFIPTDNKLIEINSGNVMEKITEACYGHKAIKDSAVTFMWTAVQQRIIDRYGVKGYRCFNLDASNVCKNLHILAESVECAACAISAYDEEAINLLLDIDGIEQFSIYIATVGKKVNKIF